MNWRDVPKAARERVIELLESYRVHALRVAVQYDEYGMTWTQNASAQRDDAAAYAAALDLLRREEEET